MRNIVDQNKKLGSQIFENALVTGKAAPSKYACNEGLSETQSRYWHIVSYVLSSSLYGTKLCDRDRVSIHEQKVEHPYIFLRNGWSRSF